MIFMPQSPSKPNHSFTLTYALKFNSKIVFTISILSITGMMMEKSNAHTNGVIKIAVQVFLHMFFNCANLSQLLKYDQVFTPGRSPFLKNPQKYTKEYI